MPMKRNFPCPLQRAALGIGEKGIAAVDDDVVRIDELAQLGEHGIDRRAGFDHDDDAARLLQRFDEPGDRLSADDIEPDGAVFQEVLGAGPGAVVNGDGVAIALDVERQVFAHDRQSDDTRVPVRPAGQCGRLPDWVRA